MRFDLEHDWQGNMATPRKNLGEQTKLKLFLILTVIWIFTGLTGHGLWQSVEADSISQILDIIQKNEFIAPLAASSNYLNNPPLYSFVAASFAGCLSNTVSFPKCEDKDNCLTIAFEAKEAIFV